MSAAARACALLVLLGASGAPHAAGDERRGAEHFRACAACHSLEPGVHLAGPSLFGVPGRKAATAEGFGRYSQAMRRSGLVWTEDTLDAWIADPAALVPDNAMAFEGIGAPGVRADLIAYLRAVQERRVAPPPTGIPDLRRLEPAYRVRAVRYCGDAYHVTTADGRTHVVWEFNLRLKTDGSARGPSAGAPALIPAGMRGDRASLVFAAPEEIGSSIRRACP